MDKNVFERAVEIHREYAEVDKFREFLANIPTDGGYWARDIFVMAFNATSQYTRAGKFEETMHRELIKAASAFVERLKTAADTYEQELDNEILNL